MSCFNFKFKSFHKSDRLNKEGTMTGRRSPNQIDCGYSCMAGGLRLRQNGSTDNKMSTKMREKFGTHKHMEDESLQAIALILSHVLR